LTSNIVNSFRFNGTRNNISRDSASDLITPRSIGVNVSTPVPNYIFVQVNGAFTGACGTCESLKITTNTIKGANDLFWTQGGNHFSLGVNYIHTYFVYDGNNNINGQFVFNGSFTGHSIADFLRGNLNSIYQGLNTADDFTKNIYGAYAQDSVQVNKKLNVNIGLRWESDLLTVETTGRGVAFSLDNFVSGMKSTVFTSAPPGLVFTGTPAFHVAIQQSLHPLPASRRIRLRPARPRAREHPFLLHARLPADSLVLPIAVPVHGSVGKLCHAYQSNWRIFRSLPWLPRRQSIPQTVPTQIGCLLPHIRNLLRIARQSKTKLYADVESKHREAAFQELGHLLLSPRQPHPA